METEILIKKITTLQKARTLLIGIDAERWITMRRDGFGNRCILGHLSEAVLGDEYVTLGGGNSMADEVFNIGLELLPCRGQNGFAAANNGLNSLFQQPIIKDRGIAALDYCIDVLQKQLEASRVNAYDELILKDNTEEVSDLINAIKVPEYGNAIID